MLPHLPVDHVYREVGVYLDAAQVILLAASAFLLWWLMRVVRQLQSVARFWMDSWNGTPGIGGLHAIDTTVPVHQKSNALASDVSRRLRGAGE
jgi:hypothetical protein